MFQRWTGPLRVPMGRLSGQVREEEALSQAHLPHTRGGH